MPPTVSRQRRRGFTLVEAIAATAIMATLTTASFALVRTANNAWLRHRDDSNRRREAVVAMQHIMRRVRQASRVTAITAAGDAAGSLTLQMTSGTNAIWSRNSGTNQVLFGTTSATNLLATGVTELTFVGLKANGSATTTQVDLIHAIRATIKYTVPRPGGSVTETLSCTAWLRSC
jgi:prepilin-type N-terminal cleavage/methylation domain-containing protein